MAHTIVLLQQGNLDTRKYFDYESVNDAMEGICHVFEDHLKLTNPDMTSITYDITQLFQFIDQLSDLSCLVFLHRTNTYAPFPKEWIKEKIHTLLRKVANKEQ